MVSSSESDEGAVDPKVTLELRTKAKRAHTRKANKLSSLVENAAPNEEVAGALAVLEDAYNEAITLNGKYKRAATLSEEQQGAANQWESEVTELFNGCKQVAKAYLRKEKRDKTMDSDDVTRSAKKRRIELEHQRQQAAIEEQRQLEDVRQRSKREQEDLTLQIEFHRQLEGLSSQSAFAPGLSSTLLNVAPGEDKIPTGCWPKITIKPFNGDPRTWPEFSLSFKAVVHDSRMPDLMKMIALRDNLEPDVRRRVSNLFRTSAVYNETWETLNHRFGNVQGIIHAHIQELLALQPFKSGDLRALINMAALVKDAVTSVDQQGATSYSNIVSQLVRVLPNELQREWGRFAYPLRPKIPGLADFDRWIEGIVGAEEFMGASTSARVHPPATTRQVKFGPTVMATGLKSPPPKSNACGVCRADPGHPLAFCQMFIDLAPTQRAEAVAKLDNCFRCLGRLHYSANCKKSTKCTVTDCDQWHHPLLHGSGRVFPRRQGNLMGKPDRLYISRPVLIALVPMLIRVKGRTFHTLGLLDPGSEATLILESLASKIGLSGTSDSLYFGSCLESKLIHTQLVKFDILSVDRKYEFRVEEAIVVHSIKGSERKIDWPKMKFRWEHLADLDLPEINSNLVGVLIGMDVDEAHLRLATRTSQESGAPKGILTPFGWAVIGRVPSSILKGPTKKTEMRCLAVGVETAESVSFVNMVESFYTTEAFGTTVTEIKLSEDDATALNILNSSIKNTGNRFEVGLLWKSSVVKLPNNRKGAFQRLLSVEKRLLKNKDLAERYTNAIEKYVHDGHARLLASTELEGIEGSVWYLPHHYVINPNKPKKIRVVFDGAAKFHGISLNDCLLRGPVLLANLVGVLIRSREAPIAVSGDIEAMYNQVRVRQPDQSFQRFLWRRPGSTEAPKTYQMMVQVFGLISSPTSCLYALQHAANNHDKFRYVGGIITKSFYVDNYIDSFETEELAIETVAQVTRVLADGGFRLNQWVSSSRAVLSSIPASERVHQTLNLDLDDLPVERSLGVLWDCQHDCFKIATRQPETARTKREMLAEISKIFDPLGFLLPITTYAKILFQQVWKITRPKPNDPSKREPLQWDEMLPDQMVKKWDLWRTELSHLEDVRVPRCFRDQRFPLTTTRFELHVFCDASEVAFGACCYLRLECEENVDVKFVFAKSRVAPIKTLSIPRLELQAAVLATRIAVSVKKELRLPIHSTLFWTDSEVVLKWLKSEQRRYSQFVHHRINEITETSSNEEWRFISGRENPADDCSRGLRPTQLENQHRWFDGPLFLHRPVSQWAQLDQRQEPTAEDLEVMKERVVLSTSIQTDPIVNLCNDRLSLEELISAVIYMQRSNEGKDKENQEKASTVAEREEALRTLIQKMQGTCFGTDVKTLIARKQLKKTSRLVKLTPFIDKNKIIRVGGRLENATELYESRHPIVLDPDHHLSILLITEAHVQTAHAGVERTLVEVRVKYWPLKGRRAIRRVVKKCVECKIQRARPAPPMMAPLPRPRLEPFQPAFASVGLDFFGPYSVVIGRRREKRWACLFTCLTTRAVHLEMVYKMDTDSFIMAFIRFSRVRGITPTEVFSDNGTNITAGEKELRIGFTNLVSDPNLPTELAKRKTHWHFSPPSAPHFGGVWERLVQSSKRAIKTILNERAVTDEVLVTVFTEVSALLNGRPLTHVSTDPNDANPLTPNHFLTQPHQYCPPDDESTFEESARKRWRHAQFIVQQYWKRWMQEYVPTLMERRKWFRENRNAVVGDRVLIVDEKSKRGEWPIGTIIKVYPDSEGGRVRQALVKTATSEYKRPVTKLCLISESAKE